MLEDCVEKGLYCEIKPESFRYCVCGRRGGVFEGVKKILECEPQKMLFATRGGTICVSGENLRIKRFTENETAITGVIKSVETL